MPKTKVTSTRAKPYAKPRDRARGSKTKPGNTLSPSLKTTLEIFQDPKNPKTAIKDSAHSLTKDFVLQLILTKLEASKTCDWHELSLKLGTEGKDMVKVSKGKTAEGWTGSELYDFYHNRILPGLKTGRALWTSSPSPSPTQSELGVTPGADEGETDDHDTETVVEEEEKLPIKARPRGAQKTHAMLKVQFEDTDEAVSSRGESMEGIVGGVEEDGKDDEYDEASGCD